MNLLRKAEELEAVAHTLGGDALIAYEIIGRVNVWKNNGAKTFILTNDLIEAFSHTDIPMESYPTDFQYPFDTFLIEGESPLFYTKTPIGGLRGVFSVMYISDTAVYKEKDLKLITRDNKFTTKLFWSKALTGFYINILGGLEYLKLNMVDDRTIGDAAKTWAGDTNLICDKEDGQNLVNLFYNTLLYVNDPDRNKVETESTGSRKLKISSKESLKSKYILLRAPKNYVSLSSSSKGGILDKRFVVRGHWRQQAYGEKYSLHKRLWIKPHYKGPELAPMDNKPYRVD